MEEVILACGHQIAYDRPNMPVTEPPFLLADTSAWAGPHPNLEAVVDFPQMAGVLLKAYQAGVNDRGWFSDQWRRLRDLGGLRGAYAFLDLSPTAKPGAVQAEGYLRAITAAGGWMLDRDIIPICDAERGKPTSRQYKVSRAQVEDTVSSWSLRVRTELGRPTMYYGRGILRDLKIPTLMGCDFIWDSGATWPMPKTGIENVPLDDIAMWQYAVDGKGSAMAPIHGLPFTVPAFAQTALDMSVFIDGDRPPTHDAMIERLVLGIHASASTRAPLPAPWPITPASLAPPPAYVCAPPEESVISNTGRLLIGLGIATGAVLAVAAIANISSAQEAA